MTASDLRKSFLEFFREKRHTVVSSASLMPDSPNLLFTNAGMNQFVPIFLGEKGCPYDPPRATDTQKCIRAGGKHNDLDDVGLDTYHHTFFEMLGNWSFGDYFKEEAIRWAWELVIERWGLPAERLYATVYQPQAGDPSAFDSEAHAIWAELFTKAGLDPAVHIVGGNKKDNFWMMGDTGPCGPCSELHVDLTPKGDTGGKLVNTGDPRCIEIWNLVFIQFNANPDGTFSELPARHVDTGMGFERVASILQGTKHFTDFANARISNYETDIFRPIFDEIETLSGKTYSSSLPGEQRAPGVVETDIAFRVIADHIRTLSFAIADGILPGNTDRNYVLRRILRRAVRYGRTLGFHGPFFYKLTDVLARTMGDAFPELRARQRHIQEILHMEEEAFNRTLDKGIELFEKETEGMSAGSRISGTFAFRLYDEQGFPLDLTELMARERGLGVDSAKFEELMEAQRARARASQKKQVIELSKIETKEPTRFVGFGESESDAKVLEVVALKEKTAVILDVTPCYAEMGGQVGDRAMISHGATSWAVADTRKTGDTWLHLLEGDDFPEPGTSISIILDRERRQAIERHHSATHLLHWAIHEVVSREASQKGSFVGPDKLTFDFNSAPLTASQVRDVERLVNERILENETVSWTEVPYEEVKGRPEIQQFFGDKYGSRVRVVQIGGEAGALNGFSMELCGGTHVRATGEIGLFRLMGEAAIAAGVRRIESLCGLEAFAHAVNDTSRLVAIASKLNSPIGDVEKKLDQMLEHTKALEKALHAAAQREASGLATALLANIKVLAGQSVILAEVPGADGDKLQLVADALKSRFDGIIFLVGSASPESVALVAASPASTQSKAPAGRLISAVAPIVGGKGGGKPDNARGGGKLPGKIGEALAVAESWITANAG
jgi:alanyl-tRNA synthetase